MERQMGRGIWPLGMDGCTHYLGGVRSLERQGVRDINRLGETEQKTHKQTQTWKTNKHRTNGMIKWVKSHVKPTKIKSTPFNQINGPNRQAVISPQTQTDGEGCSGET